jgi:hypothetical protein
VSSSEERDRLAESAEQLADQERGDDRDQGDGDGDLVV